MKLEKREIAITKEEYYWIAEDGIEFSKEYECRKHEAELHKSKAHEVFKTEKHIYDLIQPSVYYEDISCFYYLKTEEDMKNLWRYFQLSEGQNSTSHDTYNYQGEGWYVKGCALSNYVYNNDADYDIVKVDFKAWREWLAQFDWMKEEGLK